MQVARVRIQGFNLFLQCPDDMRMTMPNMRHVVIHVQILVAVRVEQPDALAFHKMYGLIVEKTVRRSQQFLAPRDQVGSVGIRFSVGHLPPLILFC